MAGKGIPIIPEEFIVSRIYIIRGKQVMLSHNLAELYQVETKVLNQQVKRNIGKFPPRYMFRLSTQEFASQRSHFVTFKEQHTKYLPYAFTEHGILMLSSVLRSERADKVNMMIIDTFVKLRELMYFHQDLANQVEKVQNKVIEHDKQILVILEYLKQMEKKKEKELKHHNRNRIGYK